MTNPSKSPFHKGDFKTLFFTLVFFGFVLSGCGATDKNTGIVEREGKILTKSGGEYVMQVGEEMINITSTKVDLDNYLKKDIKVKGMFSGSTLYVDEVN